MDIVPRNTVLRELVQPVEIPSIVRVDKKVNKFLGEVGEFKISDTVSETDRLIHRMTAECERYFDDNLKKFYRIEKWPFYLTIIKPLKDAIEQM